MKITENRCGNPSVGPYYYTDLLTLNQQREDRVPDHIDQMFQERYGFRFNKE